MGPYLVVCPKYPQTNNPDDAISKIALDRQSGCGTDSAILINHGRIRAIRDDEWTLVSRIYRYYKTAFKKLDCGRPSLSAHTGKFCIHFLFKKDVDPMDVFQKIARQRALLK